MIKTSMKVKLRVEIKRFHCIIDMVKNENDILTIIMFYQSMLIHIICIISKRWSKKTVDFFMWKM